jgi:hypothetical protein
MSIVNLDQVRATWTQRYGANVARRMMAGAGANEAAHDSRYGLRGRFARDDDPAGQPPDTTSGGEDPDSGMAQIKAFLQRRLDPSSWAQLQKMMQALNGGGEEDGPSGNTYDLPVRKPEDQPDAEELDNSTTQDEPESFAGRPRPGGQVDPSRMNSRDRRRSGRAPPCRQLPFDVPPKSKCRVWLR